MIGNRLEQSIIATFQHNPYSTISINELSKKLKKAYPYINKKVNFLLKEGILQKISIGKSYMCFLNFSSEKTLLLLSINELNRCEDFLKKNNTMKLLVDQVKNTVKTDNILCMMFNNNKLIFINEDSSKKEELQQSLTHILNVEILFMTKELFLESYLSNPLSWQNNVILLNATNYTECVATLGNKLLMKGIFGHMKDNPIITPAGNITGVAFNKITKK